MAKKQKGKGLAKVSALPSPSELAIAIAAELEKAPNFPSGATVTDVSPFVNALQTGQGMPVDVTLPRDTGAFQALPFWPGLPLRPQPIGPMGDDGRPEIRRWEYPTSWNIMTTPPSHIPWRVLRDSADYIDLIRRCIEIRKNEMTALEWDITLHDRALETAERKATKAIEATTSTTSTDDHRRELQARLNAKQDLIAKMTPAIGDAREFWSVPDRIGHLHFSDWLSMLLEEYFVLDALTIHPHADRGGALHSFEIIDGTTIKPLLDSRGGVPQPPAPAFQQVLYGYPRGEWAASPNPDEEFDATQLIYRPRHRRAFTPYGNSCTEQALVSSDLWLKRQEWIRSEYNDASIPTTFIKVPETVRWTPEQLRQYETFTNEELAGQTARRVQLRFLPPGLEPMPIARHADMYKADYDLFLVRLMCSHFDVMPSELGFVPTHGLGGKGHSEQEEASEYRKGIRPLAAWLEDLLTDISHRYLDMPAELTFKFTGLELDDEERQAKIDSLHVNGGTRTIDEVRASHGLPLYGYKETNTPMIIAGGTIQPLGDDEGSAETSAPQPPGQAPPSQAVPPGGRPAPGTPPPPQARAELAQFQRFATARAAGSHAWRDFDFHHQPATLAEALNKAARDQDWSALAKLVEHGASASDRLNTIAHHADSLAFNYAHSRKHMDEAFDTTQKMLAHIEKNPDLIEVAQEMRELEARRPEVSEPGDVGKAAARGRAKATRHWRYADQIVEGYRARIARALRGMWNVPALIARARERIPGQKAPEVAPHDAHEIDAAVRAVLGEHAPQTETATAALRDLYRDSWMSGVTAARAALDQPLDRAGGYWDTWAPGNWRAAVNVLGYDLDGSGLQQMLNDAGITIKSIAANRQDRLAELIADGLGTGMSTAALGDIIDLELGGNADMIARTETARAQTAATLDTYDENGVGGKQFLTAQDELVDDDCNENEDVGPIAIDDEFPNGDPPVHPNCRCVILPAFLGGVPAGNEE